MSLQNDLTSSSDRPSKFEPFEASFAQDRALLARLLEPCDVRLDGNRSWDIRVNHLRFCGRVLRGGSLALGESYMDGDWDAERIDELMQRLLSVDIVKVLSTAERIWFGVKLGVFNRQSAPRTARSIALHYEDRTAMFEAMLGQSMAYSCAYWQRASTLDEAQDAKHELICDKLGLGPGSRVLDIGCGWGAFAKYAASRRGCRVTGITISREQASYARTFCAGLDVEIRALDYRSPEIATLGPFDHVVSVGMFEHVGAKNYRQFMRIVSGLLPKGGLCLLQTVGRHASRANDPWVARYIFPDGMLPRAADIVSASEGLLVLEDWHNLRMHYERTLQGWLENFQTFVAENPGSCDERFQRMWRYYLLAFAGNFRTGYRNQLWQIVLSRGGVPSGYQSVR